MNKRLIMIGTLGSIATVATPTMISIYGTGNEQKQVPIDEKITDVKKISKKAEKDLLLKLTQNKPRKVKLKSSSKESLNKSVTIKLTTAQEDIETIFELARFSNSSILKDATLKSKMSNILTRFIKSGLKGIAFEDLDALLTTFNTDDKIKKIIYPLFTVKDEKDVERKVLNIKLLDIFLNKGLINLGNEKNAVEFKTIKKLAFSYIPAGINLNDGLTRKLLFTGFDSKNDFVDQLYDAMKQVPQLNEALDIALIGSRIKGMVRNALSSIYEKFSGMLKNGIFNVSVKDLKQVINWDGLISVPGLESDISWTKSFLISWAVPDDIKEIIGKIAFTSGNLDVLNTANNFLAINEIAPAGWTTFDRVTKIWDFLKMLIKSNSSDTLLGVIPTILQKGLISSTSEQIHQLSNIIDFAFNYDVKMTETSSENLKKAIIKLFNGKFADAKNKEVIDLSVFKITTSIKDFAKIAKKITAFNPKKLRKIAITRPLVQTSVYSDPAKTLADYKKQLINKLNDLYLSKNENQSHVSASSIQAIQDAKTLEDTKKIVDKLNKIGLYTKFHDGWFLDTPGEQKTVVTTIPEFNAITAEELFNYKKRLKPLFKELFVDKQLKNLVSTNTIDQAKTLQDVIEAFDELAKSLYSDDGTKFIPNILKTIEDNPVLVAEHTELTVNKFKGEILTVLSNVFTDQDHLIRIDTKGINDAKTIKEIKTAFSTLISKTLYDAAGKVLASKPSVATPEKDGLPKPLTGNTLKQTADGTYGSIINAIYKDLPRLNDFLFNGISNLKNDKAKLEEFVPKTLMPFLKTLMPILKMDGLSVDAIEPIIINILNPIINKIATS